MDREYMVQLVWLRRNLGWPLPVSSGFRCINWDNEIRGAGVHPTGHSSDILIYGHRVWELLRLALKAGFTGIGLKQYGPHRKRFVHLDDLLNGPNRPRPWIWTYKG